MHHYVWGIDPYGATEWRNDAYVAPHVPMPTPRATRPTTGPRTRVNSPESTRKVLEGVEAALYPKDLPYPASRESDPDSSRSAADLAACSQGKHALMFLCVLARNGEPTTESEVARLAWEKWGLINSTSMTSVRRRGNEHLASGTLVVFDNNGVRNGRRLWFAADESFQHYKTMSLTQEEDK